MKRIFLLLLLLLLPLTIYAGIPSSHRSMKVIREISPQLERALIEKELNLGAPVFIRIFKESKELEVWCNIPNSKRFKLFRVYEIQCFSGKLGPKQKEGDWQAPEGFYNVTPRALNPVSNFHLSFDIGYPNEYDRLHGYTGGEIMVHGSKVSIGCFAMGDKNIEEIYTLVDKAFRNGQDIVNVHIFPFRMTDEKMRVNKDSKWYEFWNNIKQGYNYFEQYRVPPKVNIKNRKYVFE